jgi:UDP-glucose:(heptosyl)LPS alpha-1,3-glucosyltransferase
MLPRLSRYGGAEQFGHRLAAYLAGECAGEFEVTFVCARQDGPAPEGVRVIRVGRPLPGKLGKTLWFTLAALAVCRRERFDVTVGLGNTISQDILRLSGGPTTLFWDHSIRAWENGRARILKSIGRRLSPGKQLARLIERMQVRRTRVLVANSHFVRDLTVQAFPFLQGRDIPVIYNQPDLTRFRPGQAEDKPALRENFGLPSHGTLIVTAGTNFRLKGVHVLIRALALLPGTFRLAVAGGRGSSTLEALAESHGVADMPTLYRAADLFVLDTFYDACANAVLEALVCGLPVISTACNGSSAFLRPEAVLPDPADHAELARRIVALIGGGPTARNDFDPPRGLAPYADLIRKLP